jgi:uncharacterized protein YaaQ
MKLVVAIVADQDANRATQALVDAGYPGPTRINTVGGFLRRGNATLLLGTDDEPSDPSHKRATIFVLNANRFIRV